MKNCHHGQSNQEVYLAINGWCVLLAKNGKASFKLLWAKSKKVKAWGVSVPLANVIYTFVMAAFMWKSALGFLRWVWIEGNTWFLQIHILSRNFQAFFKKTMQENTACFTKSHYKTFDEIIIKHLKTFFNNKKDLSSLHNSHSYVIQHSTIQGLWGQGDESKLDTSDVRFLRPLY